MVDNYLIIKNNVVIQKAYGTIENLTSMFSDCVILNSEGITCDIGDIVTDDLLVFTPTHIRLLELEQSNLSTLHMLRQANQINTMQDDTIITMYEENELYKQTTDDTLISIYESLFM